jgi:hypothetical protein
VAHRPSDRRFSKWKMPLITRRSFTYGLHLRLALTACTYGLHLRLAARAERRVRFDPREMVFRDRLE